MEAWRLSRYDRPYLAVDNVYADEDAAGAVLVADAETFDVALDGIEAIEVVRRLKELRDPASPAWPQLVAADGDDPWVELATTLDTLGLVANSDGGGGEVARSEAGRLQDIVGELVAWSRDPARLCQPTALTSAADTVHAAAGRPWTVGLPAVELSGTVNIPLTALGIQRRYWAASAPLAAATVDLLLARLREDASAAASAAEEVEGLAGGPETPRDAEAALYGAATLLALSTRADAARICSRPPAFPGRVSGTNLALAAERVAHRALEEIGPTRYLAGLESRTAPASFILGAAVEEYRVTRRFVETIAPLLVRRFRDPLRDLAFRYYREEVGHEAYEQDTCLALGIRQEHLDDGLALPYHLAYVDNFIAVAQSDAVSLLVSVMVTEGLPGDPFGINDLIDVNQFGEEYARVYRTHEAANTDLAHSTLARHFLAEVPSVTPVQSAAALDCVGYLIELTHRAWSLLYDVHTDGPWARSLPPQLARLV
jgi:hypothetical protein